MPDESLEEIRLLSNLETSRNKLLQIVLFGQPELDDNCVAKTCASCVSESPWRLTCNLLVIVI